MYCIYYGSCQEMAKPTANVAVCTTSTVNIAPAYVHSIHVCGDFQLDTVHFLVPAIPFLALSMRTWCPPTDWPEYVCALFIICLLLPAARVRNARRTCCSINFPQPSRLQWWLQWLQTTCTAVTSSYIYASDERDIFGYALAVCPFFHV